jgi:ribonuclease P protein component
MSTPCTIKENWDFSRLYRRGKSYVSSSIVIYVLKNKSNNLRYGITTGKKIGNAVKRSRSRRIIRAAFSQIHPYLKNGYDFIFVARSKTPYLKSTDIRNDMEKLFKKANLFEASSCDNEK